MSEHDVTRREFLVKTAQGASLAVTAGLMWAYLLRQEARAQPYALRPPGALAEADFNAACIKCGQCVNACPYDTLNLAPSGGDLPIGTPYFEPRKIPCYLCPDIPCMKACPTGALSPELKGINDSRMGLAVIDLENCLSWKGLRCEICHRESHKLVQGKIGDHYRLGWTFDTEITQDFKPSEQAPTAPVEEGKKPAGMDYLNEGGL